jgi:hypothetical protein
MKGACNCVLVSILAKDAKTSQNMQKIALSHWEHMGPPLVGGGIG